MNDLPERLAIDANGFGWRVYADHWSMVPTNPDNSPVPQPVTYYVPEDAVPRMKRRRLWRIRLANVISGHVNHYDAYFPTQAPPHPLTPEYLDATEAKLRECLDDRFVDDAAALMLNLLLHLRQLTVQKDDPE